MPKRSEGQHRSRQFGPRPPHPAIHSEPPLVTYGKRSKPLQLQGAHFLHSDPEPVARHTNDNHIRVQRRERTPTVEPDPDDSPLSEDELDAVYNGLDVSSIRPSPTGSLSLPKLSEDESHRRGQQANHTEQAKGLEHIKPAESSRRRGEIRPMKNPTAKALRPNDSKRKKQARPKRHLPAGELILIATPPKPDRSSEVLEECDPDIEPDRPQDPIADSSSPGHRRSFATAAEKDQQRMAPLTSHRKRLMTPRFTHKSVAAMRRKQRGESSFLISKSVRPIGDGFDSSELKIDHKVKRRKAPKSLSHIFQALQLEGGPLPKVKFLDSSCEVKIEAAFDRDIKLSGTEDWDSTIDREWQRIGMIRDDDHQKITFSDRVFNQLSSITAPKRVYSISSDDSSGEDDFEDSEAEDKETSRHEDVGETELPQGFRHGQEDCLLPEPVSATHMQTRPSICPSTVHSRPILKPSGVTLDFRSSMTPGIPPRRASLQKPRLMEVDDMIIDDPFVEQPPPSLPSDPYHLNAIQPQTVQHSPTRQPRSILRNPTPTTRDGNTGQKFTHINTRRNSIVITEDSRYFNAASGMLNRHPEQARSNSRRIVTQQANDTAASAYFARQRREVHVLDSESAVPETSPERKPRDYMTDLAMRLSQGHTEIGMTMREALPATPKDLKSLTRTVSREHGTLSQAVRRRPSLPFQSPTKVGR